MNRYAPGRHRPTNPVLSLAVDSWDSGDPFGSAMNNLLAVASVLDFISSRGFDAELPAEWEYRRGMASAYDGLDLEDYTTQDLLVHLGLGSWNPTNDQSAEFVPDLEATLDWDVISAPRYIAELLFAGKVFHRIIDVAVRGGLDY